MARQTLQIGDEVKLEHVRSLGTLWERLLHRKTDGGPEDTVATPGRGRRASTDGAQPVGVPVARAGLHGVVSAFDGNQEDWVEYAERLENYFIANDIDDEAKRRAILLNGVGALTYRLIKTLALPGRPKDLTMEEIVTC